MHWAWLVQQQYNRLARLAGPVNIHERVRRAMMVPGENHRDPFFMPFFKDLLENTKYLFQTKKGTPFIFPGAA